MANQSTMKCIACGQTGHSTTACNNARVGTLKLFGVQIDPKPADQSNGKEKVYEDDDRHPPPVASNVGGGLLRKSKSMEILNIYDEPSSTERGYQSDDANVRSQNRKKGVTWTEEEHRSFLIGLEKLGKGDWRGIAKNYVPSRTPTQVASHAQKYFNRMHAKQEKGKRRSSLFDMPINEPSAAPRVTPVTTAAPRVTPVTTIKPPVAPMVRSNSIEDFNRLSYAMNYHNIRQMHSSSDPNCSPMLGYIPVVNYSYQGRVFPVINQERVYPVTNQERVYQMTNQERFYPVTNQERVYPVVNQERVYPMINQEGVYPVTNQERVYPMINQERVYPMMNQNAERLAALQPFESSPLLITNGDEMSSPELKVDDKTQE